MASINLQDDAMADLIQQAVFSSMGPGVREQLVRDAIKSLFEKRTDRYGGGKTVFQEQFERAAHAVASREVERLLTEDEATMATIRSVIAEAVERAFSEHRAETVEAMAKVIVTAFAPKKSDW